MTKARPAMRDRIVPAGAAAAVIAFIAGLGWYGLDAISSQPIRQVRFAGDLGRIARSDLEAFAHGVQGAGAGGASLAAVREAARRIPWVREASVRRRFPDAVEVTFQTHEPLARWEEGALVSARGEIFNADYAGALPRFKGPEGSGAVMAGEYPGIVRALAPLSSAVTELRLSRRGAWQVVLEAPKGSAGETVAPPSPRPSAIGSLPQRGPRGEGELALDLGRGDFRARLERFVAAWPQVAAQGVRTRHADLRYPNGFAVKQ